jgi:hypothetical protein
VAQHQKLFRRLINNSRKDELLICVESLSSLVLLVIAYRI